LYTGQQLKEYIENSAPLKFKKKDDNANNPDFIDLEIDRRDSESEGK
jgi:hypothetical protein